MYEAASPVRGGQAGRQAGRQAGSTNEALQILPRRQLTCSPASSSPSTCSLLPISMSSCRELQPRRPPCTAHVAHVSQCLRAGQHGPAWAGMEQPMAFTCPPHGCNISSKPLTDEDSVPHLAWMLRGRCVCTGTSEVGLALAAPLCTTQLYRCMHAPPAPSAPHLRQRLQLVAIQRQLLQLRQCAQAGRQAGELVASQAELLQRCQRCDAAGQRAQLVAGQ